MQKVLNLLVLLTMFLPVQAQVVKKKIPDKLVVLTFDDATASQYSIVAPLLKEFGFGATFFICEFPPHFQDSTKYLNWRQIRELDKMGFEVANHTRTHPAVSNLSAPQFLEQLSYIDHKCDSMGIAKPSTFAYPGYNYNQAVIDNLADLGYAFARAGGNRAYDPETDHPLLVPSWCMTATNKEQITGAFREAHDGKVVVLTIHGVPDTEHPWVTTPPELFREHLQFLADQHYTVVSLRELALYVDVKKAQKTITPDHTVKLGNK